MHPLKCCILNKLSIVHPIRGKFKIWSYRTHILLHTDTWNNDLLVSYTINIKWITVNSYFLLYLGANQVKQEIQKVFLHVYSKAISPTSFVFTRKNFSAPSAMSCHEYGEQFCQIENIRALLQSHLTHLPNSESEWNRRNLIFSLFIPKFSSGCKT